MRTVSPPCFIKLQLFLGLRVPSSPGPRAADREDEILCSARSQSDGEDSHNTGGGAPRLCSKEDTQEALCRSPRVLVLRRELGKASVLASWHPNDSRLFLLEVRPHTSVKLTWPKTYPPCSLRIFHASLLFPSCLKVTPGCPGHRVWPHLTPQYVAIGTQPKTSTQSHSVPSHNPIPLTGPSPHLPRADQPT